MSAIKVETTLKITFSLSSSNLLRYHSHSALYSKFITLESYFFYSLQPRCDIFFNWKHFYCFYVCIFPSRLFFRKEKKLLWKFIIITDECKVAAIILSRSSWDVHELTLVTNALTLKVLSYFFNHKQQQKCWRNRNEEISMVIDYNFVTWQA